MPPPAASLAAWMLSIWSECAICIVGSRLLKPSLLSGFPSALGSPNLEAGGPPRTFISAARCESTGGVFESWPDFLLGANRLNRRRLQPAGSQPMLKRFGTFTNEHRQ